MALGCQRSWLVDLKVVLPLGTSRKCAFIALLWELCYMLSVQIGLEQLSRARSYGGLHRVCMIE